MTFLSVNAKYKLLLTTSFVWTITFLHVDFKCGNEATPTNESLLKS